MTSSVSRRDFAGLSLAALSTMALPSNGLAALQCAGAVLPRRLAVPCASAQNFSLFRANSSRMGLVGVVNVANAGGPFDLGTLFLYPWLKAAGQDLLTSPLRPALPYDPWHSSPGRFIPNALLPQDQYLCGYLLKLPARCFIGFSIDVPPLKEHLLTPSRTPISKSNDTKLAIEWSSTLNRPWFNGSTIISDQDVCNGAAWRKLVTDAVGTASAAAC